MKAGDGFPWDSWWRFAIVDAHLTPAMFWDSTLAQLCALLPPAVPAGGSVERGDGSDLVAMVNGL